MDQTFADLSEVERHFDDPPAVATSPAVITEHACERGTDDAMQFVRTYCQRHGLPEGTGLSEAERLCETIANEARDEFKRMRNTSQLLNRSPSTTTIENDQLVRNSAVILKQTSPQQSTTAHSYTTVDTEAEIKRLQHARKYKKRLRNNRRSAHAAKVYKEVLRRAFSHHLASSTKTGTFSPVANVLGKTQRQETDAVESSTVGNVNQDTMVSLNTFRAVQQENLQLKMLLFQHGIICQPFITPAVSYSNAQPVLSILSGMNSATMNHPVSHAQLPDKLELQQISNYTASNHLDSESS